MLRQELLTLVLAGGAGARMQPLTNQRCKPAVPFGGTFRIIVEDAAELEGCILFPGARVSHGARLRHVIVEENVTVPPGLIVGHGEAHDDALARSPGGVSVITASDTRRKKSSLPAGGGDLPDSLLSASPARFFRPQRRARDSVKRARAARVAH